MSTVPCWPEETLTEIRRLRDAGKSWVEVGDALQICPKAAQRLGKRLGLTHAPAQRRASPRARQPRAVAQTQPVQRGPEQLAGARPTMPPGATWALLTAGTCLDGQPYSHSDKRPDMIEECSGPASATPPYTHPDDR